MNQIKSNKQRVLKCKTPITVLALIALICTVLSTIIELFNSSSSTSFLLYLVIDYLPSEVLLLLYIFIFFKNFKATIVVPIIFARVPATILLYAIVSSIGSYVFSHFFGLSFFVFCTIIMFVFILPIISALKGLTKKAFIVIPTLLLLLFYTLSLAFLLLSFNSNHSFSELFSTIASIAFNTALLIFGLKNRIPSILAPSTKKGKKQMSPEETLRLLKDEFDLGMITEEEYRAQRFDIISKL